MQDFEKLGAFYLGRRYDLAQGKTTEELLLYDSKDLTTHAVCVGMTGSGKTGLCLSLLEEAGIDGVPAIVIDPKGDLGNLMLTFPQLAPSDFRPWIDESLATRSGMNGEQFAAATAKQWREGLARWGQDASRIARFRDAVDVAIYTPGSSAGLPLTVLRSFDAPPAAVIEDGEALRARVSSATSGLLALLGVGADPVRSREHILVANLLDRAWREGRSLDLPALIREIQSPPFDRVGIMDLESFYPGKDRFELSMLLNNLLASPSFAGWMEGEAIDVKRLLYTAEGKPRISILSIAHLSDAERMFFVTILLNEVIAWMRGQPGTPSLRALLYMDEVFGYFPPTANPPSKLPMLTLLKQARAYGLGVVLATQNPVDLDYKGLANTGTWFLGRLQTERDKARVLEGLEGVSAQAGVEFDRQKMEATLAGLGKRVFLMNNVHDDHPVVFRVRWALSYLRGPLTQSQIRELTEPQKQAQAEEARPATASSRADAPAKEPLAGAAQEKLARPALPVGIEELFLAAGSGGAGEGRLVYRPALLGHARLHFVRAPYHVDVWQERRLLAAVRGRVGDDVWKQAAQLEEQRCELDDAPNEEATFAELPAELARAKSYSDWKKRLKDYLYRSQSVDLWRCASLKQYSEVGEAEDDFRIRLSQLAHEQRDLRIEKLRKRYASKLATLHDRIRRAEERVEREKSQFQQRSYESVISVGSSILGALLGRKMASRTNVGRASTSMRSVGRAARERGDIAQAKEKLEVSKRKLADLQAQFEKDVDEIEETMRPESLEFERLSVRPRKSDIAIEKVALVWTPWRVDSAGIAEPAY